MSLPKSIVLEGNILEDFLQMSGFFEALDRWEGHKSSYTLTAERLFDGDKHAWSMFVDLFFPETVPQMRKLNDGTFSLTPAVYYNTWLERWELNEDMYTKEEIDALFDFLLIDKDIHDTVIDYIKAVHARYRGNSPSFRYASAAPRLPPPPSRNEFNFPNESNNGGLSESEENENNVQLGFKNEEEEEAYGKLKSANYKRYAPNGGKRRRNKTKKLKKRSS